METARDGEPSSSAREPPLPKSSNSEDKKRKIGPDDEEGNRPKYRVSVRNRYEPLTDTSDSESDEQIPSGRAASPRPQPPKPQRPAKHIPPPPITLHDDHNHKDLSKMLEKAAKGPFSIKYTREGTSINLQSREDRERVVEKFKEMNLNFHTYTDKSIKTNAYVIRGLSKQTSAEDITAELADKHSIEAIRCNKMTTKGAPLFMIVLPAAATWQAIEKIAAIDRTMVRWQRYTTTRRITQCHNCQMWGHATSNCFASPICMKCAGRHATRECTKTRETPAKCANCGADHPASSIDCPRFQERKSWLDARSASRTQRESSGESRPQMASTREFPALPRKFAPAPTSNPWHRGNQRGPPPEPTPPPREQTTRAAPTPRPRAATAPAPGAAAAMPVAAFKELAEEMRKLNSLINIHEVLRQIKSLNVMLQSASTEGERMQIAVQFFASLP